MENSEDAQDTVNLKNAGIKDERGGSSADESKEQNEKT